MVVRRTGTAKLGKVLIINSDPEIIHILEMNLAHANIETVAARSGLEALTKLQNNDIDSIILDPALPDIGGAEIYRKVNELSKINHTPLILLSSRLPRKNLVASADNIPLHYVTKPFDPREVVTLVLGCMVQKERLTYVNPLTGLPNRLQIVKEIDRFIQNKKTFTTMYIALHDLPAIKKRYGRNRGEQVVQLLADTVSRSTHLFGNARDLAGYFGGGKFVIITTTRKARPLCREIIADFSKQTKTLLDVTDQLLSEYKEITPLVSIHIALVSNSTYHFKNSSEVTKTAMTQIEYLKQTPESNCYFDLNLGGNELFSPRVQDNVSRNKEERKTIQNTHTWFDCLTGELTSLMNMIEDCLQPLKSIDTGKLNEEQAATFKDLITHYNQLTGVVDSISNLSGHGNMYNLISYDVIDIRNTVDKVIHEVQTLTEPRQITCEIKETGDIEPIFQDKKVLTQSLLYIVRHEILASSTGSRLCIHLKEKNNEYICLEINNPDHQVSTDDFNNIFNKPPDVSSRVTNPIEGLFGIRLLLRSIGAELNVQDEKKKGITYYINIPKRWRSLMQEVDTLRLAMDLSRKEAYDTLTNLNIVIASCDDLLPPETKDNCEKLNEKIQELSVLCSRSLILADDLGHRLESLQDRSLQQESEQLTALEAILICCRETARSMAAMNIFEPESARRVAYYALAIANELNIAENERQVLRYAALFKDMSLTLSSSYLITRETASTIETAEAIKTHFNLIWKGLSMIRHLAPALGIIQFMQERFEGNGGRFGVKGNDIPLGSRIIAVANTFDSLISGQGIGGVIEPQEAMQKIAEEAGQRFDPDIVSAFLLLWKRGQLEPMINVTRMGLKDGQVLT